MRSSPTQVDTFEGCQRKWAWIYIAGLRGIQNESAALGSRVHKVIEDFFTLGTPIDMTTLEGEIAMSAYHLWPSRETVLATGGAEVKFNLWIGGVEFAGIKDLAFTSPKTGRRVVADHKTTKNFRYGKTATDLRTRDVAAAVYAMHEMLTHGVAEIELEWYYMTTEGHKKSLLVAPEEGGPLVITREDIKTTLERVEKVAQQQVKLRLQQANPLSLPPSPPMCEAYGGCPFRDRCNLSEKEKVRAIMTQAQSVQDMLAQVQQRVASPGAPPAPPAANAIGYPDTPTPPDWGWVKSPEGQWNHAPLKGWAPPPGWSQIYDPRAPVAAPVAPALPPAAAPPPAPVAMETPAAPAEEAAPKKRGRPAKQVTSDDNPAAAFASACYDFGLALYSAFGK